MEDFSNIRNKEIHFRRLRTNDYDSLFEYLQNLSTETTSRFGPHLFDKQSIIDTYEKSDDHIGFVAVDPETDGIIAYSIIKTGCLNHDSSRLMSYGLELNNKTDCTFAPSVADLWQNCGIGKALFNLILSEIIAKGISRIILWGGVQSDNKRAIEFYLRNGFRVLGEFEYNGLNLDMIYEIPLD